MNAELHSPLPRAPRRFFMVVIGLVILASGIVIGAGGTIIFMRYKMERMRKDPDHMRKVFTERISDRLSLDEKQTEQVAAILEAHHAKLVAVHQEMEPRMDALFQTMREDVATVLTTEQAAEWKTAFGEIFPPPPENGMPPPPPGRK